MATCISASAFPPAESTSNGDSTRRNFSISKEFAELQKQAISEQAPHRYLMEIEKLVPLMASISVGPEVMQYSAKLYFSLAVRDPKFAHLYIRLLAFLHERCSQSQLAVTRETGEMITIQSIISEECKVAIETFLLSKRPIWSLTETCARFILLGSENKNLDSSLNATVHRDIPTELHEYLAGVSQKIEQECTTIVDPDEQHEQQKVRQKKRGIGILFAELCNNAWIPMSSYLDVIRRLLQSFPCLHPEASYRSPSYSCCLPTLYPVEKYLKLDLGSNLFEASRFCINKFSEEEDLHYSTLASTSTTNPTKLLPTPVSSAPLLTSDIYSMHKMEERLFLVELTHEMLQRTATALLSDTAGKDFLLSYCSRLKYLMESSTSSKNETHFCLSPTHSIGVRLYRVTRGLLDHLQF
eukprot:TRINITY_DN4224_c0_g1_i1.p1 TRINITY_DN4224_c0_g1~~TRINITY_DN4224_c0_g1_i1.p1  ORF type:complete len:412 (+),score=53.40 TRINITY_DN4224_c0_g1_i1:620-1855(+)